MKKTILIFIVFIGILLLSGCVEQENKKNVSMKINDYFVSVDTPNILFYVEFNDSINGEVKFYLDDKFIGTAKIANKTAMLIFNTSEIQLNKTTYKIRTLFENGNVKIEKTSKLYVLKKPSRLSIYIDKEKIYFKDILNLSVNLECENASNKEIQIYVDDKYFGKNLTDENGKTEFYLNFSNVDKTKIIKIKAVYSGDNLFENSTAEREILVTQKIPTEIIANDIDIELTEDNISFNYVNLSAIVMDYKNNILNDSLKFYYSNKPLTAIKNNNTYTLNLTTFKKIGNYKVDIIFENDNIYENTNKSITLNVFLVYPTPDIKIKSHIKKENIKNKKFSIYTDNSNLTKFCAYEFADISDQDNGIPMHLYAGNKNEVFIRENFIQIFIEKDEYSAAENIPCHAFLCFYKDINCSLNGVISTLSDLKNFTVVLDANIKEKKILNEYIEILKALGFIQSYLKDRGKNVLINQYIIENGKCAPASNLKNFTSCDFDGIFIIYSNESQIYSQNGKIFLKGNNDTLYYEELILKSIILPDWKELL